MSWGAWLAQWSPKLDLVVEFEPHVGERTLLKKEKEEEPVSSSVQRKEPSVTLKVLKLSKRVRELLSVVARSGAWVLPPPAKGVTAGKGILLAPHPEAPSASQPFLPEALIVLA